MKEMESCALPGASNEKLPSMSVMVPLVVPFTTTLAPMIGSPFLSITLPVMRFCCEACALDKMIWLLTIL